MNAFQSARLKLTIWYLIIIMIISALFSATIYGNVSRQIEGLVRMHNNKVRNFEFRPPQNNLEDLPPVISIEDLQEQEEQLLYTLLLINLFILIIAGGSGYFLAGRTLCPIRIMMDEQNQFISDASHELRTPLATLRAEMEGKLLEKNISVKEARKLIVSNLEELNTLEVLSNSLLKLTKVHSLNNGDAGMEKVSLPEVVKNAQIKISSLAKKKNISIATKMSDAIVLGNKASFTEVFTILLDNAIKYSPENSKIQISLEVTSHKVKIFVSDQGIGISKKDLPHIFERFFRADKSRSKTDGYGLGLSIAKRIVENYNGSIAVTSTVGKGSVFEVILPLA